MGNMKKTEKDILEDKKGSIDGVQSQSDQT